MAAPVNISVSLNTNITSNLTGPGPDETEALTLIDEPMPDPGVEHVQRVRRSWAR